METLQKDTGLTMAVIAHALQPLTGDKGILTQDPEKGETSSPPACQKLTPDVTLQTFNTMEPSHKSSPTDRPCNVFWWIIILKWCIEGKSLETFV